MESQTIISDKRGCKSNIILRYHASLLSYQATVYGALDPLTLLAH